MAIIHLFYQINFLIICQVFYNTTEILFGIILHIYMCVYRLGETGIFYNTESPHLPHLIYSGFMSFKITCNLPTNVVFIPRHALFGEKLSGIY